jgi:hypothetical protein
MVSTLARCGENGSNGKNGKNAKGRHLAINQWVEMPGASEAAHFDMCQPIYVPTRGQVLFWGGTMGRYRVRLKTGNDVRAFDVAKGKWVSDHPSSPKAGYWPGGHGAAPNGIGNYGTAKMMADGKPYPSAIVNGVCWDSKRKRVVYTMAGMTAAYDPGSKTWTDLKAKNIPSVYGVGSCYDPVNDEIVMFPHFKANNLDQVPVHGRVYGHNGTYVMSFKDMTWRRVSDTFGSEDVKKARKDLFAVMGALSRASDMAYGLRRRKDFCKPAEITGKLDEAVAGLEKLKPPGQGGKEALSGALAELRKAAAAGKSGKWEDLVAAAGRALWKMDEILDGALRVEPPARCAAPMVYDPENKVIVMFGGHSGLVRTDLKPPHHLGAPPGALNDTWVYDVQTRQWRELACGTRPPEVRQPMLFYEPKSKKVVLVVFSRGATDVWTLDVAGSEWKLCGSPSWKWPVSTRRCYASRTRVGGLAYDRKAGVVVFAENKGGKGRSASPATYVMKLDLGAMGGKAAPAWKPRPPITYHKLPPDDPAWVAKLKGLPANTWTRTGQKTARRDWGNVACDPVRGHVYYFGGGHSTYQVNDVAVYAVGANKWVFAAGDNNDFVPPSGWGGCCMSFRGGAPASHQRNKYVAFDGRMYRSTGGWSKLNRGSTIARGRKAGSRWAHFYDLDRGGVWRKEELTESEIRKGEKVDGVWSACHVVDPRGYVLGFVGDRSSYYGATYPNVYVSVYDVYTGKLEVRNSGNPHPQRVGESRPYCFLTGRNAMFFYECSIDRKTRKPRREHTWIYDVKTNAWKDLKPARQPGVKPDTVEYIDGQNAVMLLSAAGRSKAVQWVYSLEKNTWAPLPFAGAGLYVGSPYGQVAYVAKYGVLVGVAGSTTVMRPDVSKAKWE